MSNGHANAPAAAGSMPAGPPPEISPMPAQLAALPSLNGNAGHNDQWDEPIWKRAAKVAASS